MENISDVYYLTRFIVGRMVVYLRDTILRELSWFPDEMNELDASETKPRAHPFARRAIADFVAFFTICALFCSFIIYSTKCSKDNDNHYNSSSRPVTPESESQDLELVEDEDYPISQIPMETSLENRWNETMVAESDLETTFGRRKLPPRNRNQYFQKHRNSRSSIIELRSTHSQHSQSTQTNERIIKRVANNRDWLIRRTRSGHIYGKYPM